MNEEFLKNQIDYVQARIEEMDDKVINTDPSEKEFKGLIDNYNKWTDQYMILLDRLEHINDENLEREKLDLEKIKVENQFKLEMEKLNRTEELEQDKLNLDRDKFAYEVKKNRWEKPVDIILKVGDIGARVAVPLIGMSVTTALATLAYMNDSELKLCNGRIQKQAETVLRIMTSKV